MKKYNFLILVIIFLSLAINISAKDKKPIITFLEIGSKSCIPCKKMQPIMKSLEKRYGEQIEVIFHNTSEERDAAKKFGIRLIPTQIFLDKDGKEVHRHEGYYPESEIDKFLKTKGLKPKS